MKKKQRRLSASVILGIAVLLIIFGIIADFIGYTQFTSTLTAQYQDNAVSIADEAVTLVNVKEIEGFIRSGEPSPGIAALEENMQKLCNTMKAEFIYIIKVDQSDYGEIEFIFEVVNASSKFSPYEYGHKQPTTNDEYRARYEELYDGLANSAIIVRDKGVVETGSHITVLEPLRDDSGNTIALLAVQRQMEYLGDARAKYLNSIVIASVVLMVVAGAGWFVTLRRRLLKPLKVISNEVVRFSSENTLPESQLADKIRYNDELGTLATTVDEMEKKTLDYFLTLNRVSADKQRVDAELNLATDIQANMLPRIFPPFPEHDEFDIFATMEPAREVGGDFYDFYMIDEKHVAVVMADVSGKGVPAALFMVITKTLIKNHAQLGLSPEATFTKINEILCEGNSVGLFVTAWMGVLDIDSGELTYVNAGHNPPLIKLGDGAFEYLKSRPGFVLAGMEGVRYRQQQLKMSPGDRLFLYTDGVTEATDTNNKLYGEERLSAYLNAHSSDGMKDILYGLRADINKFVGEAEQFDDITMLILNYDKKN